MSRIIEISSVELPGALARDMCRNGCGEVGYLARYIHANGAVALRWVCDYCQDFKTSGDLPHAWFRERFDASVDDLSKIADNSLEPRDYPPCVVCGDDAPHGHHWAPVSIFPDWPYGLIVNLCVPHHDDWHARMRAHGLRWPHEQEAA